MDEGTSPLLAPADNPSQPTWTLALRTMFARMPALKPQEQHGSQRPEGGPGVFVVHRHLYTNVVKLPTWASREPEESKEEPGCSLQPSRSAHCPHPDQLCEKEMVQCKRGLVPVLAGERVEGPSFPGLFSLKPVLRLP